MLYPREEFKLANCFKCKSGSNIVKVLKGLWIINKAFCLNKNKSILLVGFFGNREGQWKYLFKHSKTDQ